MVDQTDEALFKRHLQRKANFCSCNACTYSLDGLLGVYTYSSITATPLYILHGQFQSGQCILYLKV